MTARFLARVVSRSLDETVSGTPEELRSSLEPVIRRALGALRPTGVVSVGSDGLTFMVWTGSPTRRPGACVAGVRVTVAPEEEVEDVP